MQPHRIYKKFRKQFEIKNVNLHLQIEYSNDVDSPYIIDIWSGDNVYNEHGKVNDVADIPTLLLAMKDKIAKEIEEVNENTNKIKDFLNEF